MYQELIDQIVVLMEEMAADYKTSGDPVRDLYSVYRDTAAVVGDRMGTLAIVAKEG